MTVLQRFGFNLIKSHPVSWFVGAIAIAVAASSCAQLKQVSTPPANASTTALAEHLTQTGAKMYGTYWCPYCNKQEEMFGSAIQKVQVIECDPKGDDAKPQECAKANVSSFPTWEIKGKLYRGMRSLEELAQLSDYKGSTDFAQSPQ